jgi:hypothetical protein
MIQLCRVFFTSPCMDGTGSRLQLLWWGWWSLVVLGGMMVSSEDEADDPPDPNPLRKGPGKPGAYAWCCFTRGPYHNKRSSARCKSCGQYWAQPRVSQLEKHIIDECRGDDLIEDQRQTHIVLIAQSKAPVGGGTAEAAAPAGPAPLLAVSPTPTRNGRQPLSLCRNCLPPAR